MGSYKKSNQGTSQFDRNVSDGLSGDLDMLAREGARQMLVAVLEAEVTEFLGRQRYERTDGDDVEPGPLCANNSGTKIGCSTEGEMWSE